MMWKSGMKDNFRDFLLRSVFLHYYYKAKQCMRYEPQMGVSGWIIPQFLDTKK